MMFDDKEWIKKLVNMRDEDQIVIPLYVQIYGKKYSLLELDTIKVRFSEGAFKIGYGTADSLFMPNSFPINRIRDFDVITVFTEYDNGKDRTIRYMVFESGNIDLPDVEEKDKLSEEICSCFDMLYTHVKDVVDGYFKALIAEEEHPIIPREEPKKEEPIVDEEDEEEDPLDELRKEVAEYSQDDEDDKLLIVETDNTGTKIMSATEATLDLSKDVEIGNGLVDMFGNEVNDDYLSEEDEYPRVTEGGLIGKETVDFINGENKYSDDNEDYSTDFDIF